MGYRNLALPPAAAVLVAVAEGGATVRNLVEAWSKARVFNTAEDLRVKFMV